MSKIVQIRTLVSISVAVPDFEIAHVERCAALCVLQSEVDAEPMPGISYSPMIPAV